MIWFSSDWHLGHVRILELCDRPFGLVDDMNRWLIDAANDVADKDDTIIFLGDQAMGQIADSLALFTRIHARMTLIPGNHDRCSPLYEGYVGKPPDKVEQLVADWTGRYEDVGFTVLHHNTFSNNEFDAWLNHFPYDADPRDERFAAHRPVDKGEWLLHGHVHQSWRQRGRQINVGVDAWGGRLVPQTVVAAMVHAGPAMLDPLPWTLS